jgi:hypothetical protein
VATEAGASRQETPAQRERRLQREWWLRVPLVLTHPRAVFVAMRDESEDALLARQEPVLAIVFLAGIATVLDTSVASELLDDPAIDGWLIAVWAIIGGLFYGIVSYWIGGLALYLGSRGASAKHQASTASFQRVRHVLGYAATPIAVSILLWPFRLAIYGSDTFRTGGADTGAGPAAFRWLSVGFAAWAFGLLLYGIRTTYGWTWVRALGTVILGCLALTCVVLVFYLV